MGDKNNSLCGALGLGSSRGGVECGTCICTDKIFDAVKDKECLEDLRVFLGESGQDAVERANNIRAKSVEIVKACLSVSDVAFNRGYYSVSIRLYFRICFEACIPGGRSADFCGIAVYDKNLVLYGGEGNVSVFTSDTAGDRFCCDCDRTGAGATNLPRAVLEAATPIVLGVKVVDRSYQYGCCCCAQDQLPEYVQSCVPEPLTDNIGTKNLYITLGVFSIVRMQRPQTLMIQAADYCIPEKDSGALGTDTATPCEIFKNMCFPTAEFCPPAPPCCREVGSAQAGCRTTLPATGVSNSTGTIPRC